MTGFGLTDLPFPWFLRSTHNDSFTGLVPVDSTILLDYRSARDRRTGVGLLIMTTRMARVLGLIIALYVNLATPLSVYICPGRSGSARITKKPKSPRQGFPSPLTRMLF
ncbi:hypothetical protein M405DRAFT_598331 [Rhizopogon salebrosus TDB-379]|nr:hypothetical protein M405DRAFT_598331 [Rhizopogon salebrosus TDB-379]